MKGGYTALMEASKNGHLNVVNRLVHWQQTQIREGFEIAYSYGSFYVPMDLMELVIEFTL